MTNVIRLGQQFEFKVTCDDAGVFIIKCEAINFEARCADPLEAAVLINDASKAATAAGLGKPCKPVRDGVNVKAQYDDEGDKP